MISTLHLKLYPLTLNHLKTGLHSINELSSDINIPLVPTLISGVVQKAVRMKIEKMEKEPVELHNWFTYWLIIIKADNIGIGLVGFKGSPDSAGSVEIGYGLDENFRGQGFMSEAVKALLAWAFSHSDCNTVTATNVLKTNFASQKVLKTNQFIVKTETQEVMNFILLKQDFKPDR